MVSAAAEIFVMAHTRQAIAEIDRLKLTTVKAFSIITKIAELAAVGFVAMAGSVWIASSAVKSWQTSLVNAAAIGGLTEKQMWALGEASTEAGKQIGLASDVIAEGYVQLTRAGFQDMNDIMTLNNVIMRAAVANQISYAEAAEVVIKSVKAFNISVDDAYDKIAVLQYVANQTQAEFIDFNKALTYAGSTSYFAGLSFEELAAMMGVLSDIAMEAGIGARGLNRMIIQMIEDVPRLEKFLASFGVTVQVVTADGRLNLEGIINAFEDIDVSMHVLEASAEQFSIRALRSWLGLISHTERYNELMLGLGDATSYFNTTFQAQIESLSYITQRISEQFSDVFKKQEVVEKLERFFNVLLFWLDKAGKGGAEKITKSIMMFFDAAITHLPIMLRLTELLFDSLNTFLPLLVMFANVGITLTDTLSFLNANFLELYIIFSFLKPMWTSLVFLAEAFAQYQLMLADTTLLGAGANVIYSKSLENVMIAASAAGAAVGSLMMASVGAYMAGMMAAGSMGALSGEMVMLSIAIAWVNAAMATFLMLSMAAQGAKIGIGGAIAAVIIASAIVGASYHYGREAGKAQKKKREEEMTEMEEEMSKWRSIGGSYAMPSAASGEPYVPRDMPYYVHEGERILTKEENARMSAASEMVVNITVESGAVVTLEELKESVLDIMRDEWRRQLAVMRVF